MYILRYKHILVTFHLRINEREKLYFSVVLFKQLSIILEDFYTQEISCDFLCLLKIS